jgi:hypothetical protein
MITHHAKLARVPAEQPGLPERVHEAIGTAYKKWGGRGWSGVLEADAVPVAARIAQLAGFMEVAHRVGSIRAATTLARKRAGRQFGPRGLPVTRSPGRPGSVDPYQSMREPRPARSAQEAAAEMRAEVRASCLEGRPSMP